jgi:hypothetical protein
MISVIQVEYQRDGGVCPTSTFGIPTEKTKSAASLIPYSQHASEVAALFYGPDSYAGKAGVISKVFLDEATGYANRDGLGAGLVNMPPPNPPRWPAKALAMVENHSYGWAHHSYSSGLARMDERIERDNVVVVVAAPNEGSQTNSSGGANGFYSQCKNVIVAGSTYGTHYDWPNRPCDVLVDQQWTSWCAPVLASAACLVVAEFIKANYPYRWNEVKDILIKTATNKVLNVDAAVAEAKKIAAPKQEEEDPIMIKELEEKLAAKQKELDDTIWLHSIKVDGLNRDVAKCVGEIQELEATLAQKEEELALKEEELKQKIEQSIKDGVENIELYSLNVKNTRLISELNNEIDLLKAEIAKFKNVAFGPLEGNFYPFNNSTEIRAAMNGEKIRAPIAVAFPHAGNWVYGKGIYDKAGKIIYATIHESK